MLKISYAGCLGQSSAILAQFTLETTVKTREALCAIARKNRSIFDEISAFLCAFVQYFSVVTLFYLVIAAAYRYLLGIVSALSLDVDECTLYQPCHKYAYCYNTVGSYKCQCMKGYYGDGKYCRKIDYETGRTIRNCSSRNRSSSSSSSYSRNRSVTE